MSTSSICLDASAAVLLVTDEDAHHVLALWEQWEEEGRQFVAPTLFSYEVINALYQYRRHDFIDDDVLAVNVQTILALPIRLYMDEGLHVRAIDLALEYELPASYDAHYLAVAERFHADLWTADRRLYRKTAHLSWVHSIRDETADDA